MRDARPDWIVEVAHLEIAPPSIAEGIARCAARGAQEIVVHPYFLAPGRHTTEDIPRLVREAAEAYPQIPVRVSRPLGLHPKLVDVILDRVEDAR